MSSRPDDPESTARRRARGEAWASEPEVAPASGGHLAAEVHSPGPMFEGLVTEPPGSPEAATGVTRRTSAPRARGAPTRRQRPLARRVKRTVKHVNPWSVFKMSLFFYGLAMVAWLLFVAIVYSFINSLGTFDKIEDIAGDLAVDLAPDFTLFFFEKWAVLIGLILWLGGSLVNLVAAFLYNVGADAFGGIELTFVEKDS